jgi:hypothetical protein
MVLRASAASLWSSLALVRRSYSFFGRSTYFAAELEGCDGHDAPGVRVSNFNEFML